MIDAHQVEELAAIQCTVDEIAAVLGYDRRTIFRHIKEPELNAAIERGRARGRASVRREQYKLLQAGNATMGVWLGKQYLGQSDKSEISGPGGGPLQFVNALRKVLQAAPDSE